MISVLKTHVHFHLMENIEHNILDRKTLTFDKRFTNKSKRCIVKEHNTCTIVDLFGTVFRR